MFGEDHARGPFLDSPVRARSCHIALQFGSIRSAFRSRESAHWGSWADCLAMVKARHPVVAARIVGELVRFTRKGPTLANPVLAILIRPILANPILANPFLDRKGWGPNPEKIGPRRVGQEGWGPEGWGAQNVVFFFPSPAAKFILFFSGGLLVELWWCLKRRGAQMCTFGILGLLCEAPAAPKPPKFHEKNPPEREERNEFCSGRGKKRELLGPPPFGAPLSGLAPLRGRTDCETTETLIWAKIKLAKNGFGQNWSA